MKKKALITGITGQDGSYLAELLVSKGYEVTALIRRSSFNHLERIQPLLESKKIEIVEGDLLDGTSLRKALEISKPDEVYNIAAMSHVQSSFAMPEYTADVDGLAVLRLLEAIREINPTIRFYQASTSELFGKVTESPQKETTPFYPKSAYGVAKLYPYWTVVNVREAYNLFACNGILFSHESPRRGKNFVSRKITESAIELALGLKKPFNLGTSRLKEISAMLKTLC